MATDRHPLSPLFDPASIAVFGASERKGGVGAQVFAKLTSSGFAGPVYPVNPKYTQVLGYPALATISDAPGPVDLAVICTPAATVPDILRACARHGTKHAIVLSAGFGEAGTGTVLQDALMAAVRETGVRVLGPNCVGLVRPWAGLDATFLRSATPKGGLALVSQSGALCSAIADWAEPNGMGMSALVSLGNALDIGFGDVVEFLADDPKTRAILLYVEGVRNGPAFVSALRYATWRKPVVVLKTGRNAEASRAAATHTGALMGDDDIFDAALARTGAVRAMTFGQLFAAAEMLSTGRRAGGNRLAIVTNGGGAGVLAADRASEVGVTLPALSSSTIETLNAVLPAHWSRGNPIDVIGDATPDQFGAATRAALADRNFDGVLAMLTPQAMTDPMTCANTLIAAGTEAKKPVLACWMGQSSVAEARAAFTAAGIPEFTTPERAVEAFSFLARHARQHALALEVPGPRDISDEDIAAGRSIVAGAIAEGRSLLTPLEAKRLLAAFGVPTNVSHVVADPAELSAATARTGFPVAMKILSPDISHKSDVDGVRLGIASLTDAEAAFAEITDRARALRPEARIDGVTVEPMARVTDARELLVGVSRDPVFGAALAFGIGGTMVEVLRDRAIALPPLTEVLARRMIARTRADRLLGAFRNLAEADRSAVVTTLLRVSDMVSALPEVIELDINPLLAGPDGVLAIDVRVVVAAENAAPGPHLSVAPYPAHIDIRATLPDGQTLHIRPIRAEDAQQEEAFVRNLSPTTRRLRFFGATSGLRPDELVRFTQIDFRRELALVALIEPNGTSEQVGVARYHLSPDGAVADFAVVVSDTHRRLGIGRRLLDALVAEARRVGIARLRGAILRENEPMRAFCAAAGCTEVEDASDPETFTVELPVT